MLRYMVVRCLDLDQLIKQVNDWLDEEWLPQGGIAIEMGQKYAGAGKWDSYPIYLQAMMRQQT